MNTFPLSLRAVVVGAALFGAVSAGHADNAPYDFGYRVTGSPSVRPSLVFNDGQDTYIQPLDPNAPIRVVGAKSTRQGPYIVVLGIPKEFALVSKSLRANIQRQAASMPPDQQPEKARAPAADAEKHGAAHSVPAIAEKPTAAETPSCRARWAEHKTSIAIEVRGGALGAMARDRLQGIAYAKDLNRITIHPPRAERSHATSNLMVQIRRALTDAGVPSSQVETGSASALADMVTVDLIVRSAIPCPESKIQVTTRAGLVTVVAQDVPVAKLLAEVAEKVGLSLIKHGDPKAIAVNVNLADAPPREVFASIGRQLGQKATLVLRDRELELNYEN